MRTTVTTKNMVTIPSALSRQYGISPGCRLEWEPMAEGEIRVHVVPKRGVLARRLKGGGKRWAPKRDGVAELVAERSAEG